MKQMSTVGRLKNKITLHPITSGTILHHGYRSKRRFKCLNKIGVYEIISRILDEENIRTASNLMFASGFEIKELTLDLALP